MAVPSPRRNHRPSYKLSRDSEAEKRQIANARFLAASLEMREGLLATVQQSATQNTGLQNASGESNVVPAVLFGVFYS
jgi:hypothetical protein